MAAVAEQVAIVGDGQMGLVLAALAAERGLACRLWGRDASRVSALAATRRSPKRLTDFELPAEVEVTADEDRLLDGATVILSCVPTQFIRPVWERLGAPDAGVPIVSLSKGLEKKSLLRPTQVIADATGDDPDRPRRSLCALSGPTIAAELARRLPATMVAAADDIVTAARVQDLFSTPWMRIYRLDDLIGVEIAGATKNVIALAAGMIDGLGLGFNAKSALLSRGLAEIARLGAAMGARVDTFFGVAGVGDLATTCFCPEGRNRTCGERLGRGETLASILDSTSSVVEGVATTHSVAQMAADRGIDMPITMAVHEILSNNLSPRDAISTLMSREPKAEKIG